MGPLLVVTGPTASGKTDLALALARALDGELIGADSVQVYRGFDIGSNKPTPEELGGVPHHLIDVTDPDQELDAVRYAQLADDAIAGTRARGRVPIVVGGSGLWLRALLRGLLTLPPPDPALRARLEQQVDQRGLGWAAARLREVDPDTARAVHPNDRVRIVRALEVHAQTGTPLGQLRARHDLGSPRYDALRVVLDPRPDLLQARIARRTAAMLAAGFADEVRALWERWGDVRPMGAVGYRQMLPHVRGLAPLSDAARAVERATRVYARRQRTWLRSEPGARWDAQPAQVLSPEGVRRLQAHLAAEDRSPQP